MQGFISYSHRDADSVDRLRRQLYPITRALGVDLWIDGRIHAGDVWDRKIRDALDRATLFLFCISSDLIFSKCVDQVELRAAREKQREASRGCRQTDYPREARCASPGLRGGTVELWICRRRCEPARKGQARPGQQVSRPLPVHNE
jgi:hypothetical protein